MNTIVRSALITLSLLTGMSACIRRPVQLKPTASSERATPIADSPAAGICAEHEGSLVSVTIYPDIPDPRCSLVRADQHLRVINMRSERIEVNLARLQTEIAPGEDCIFVEPFAALLMPGVHRFDVSPCCGAEIVLRTEAQ